MTWRLTPRAERDLVAISDYIAADNPRAAVRLVTTIRDKCRLLGEHPHLGPARPDIAPDLRIFVVGRYLILYRIVAGGIEVVRVVHGMRDRSALLEEN